MKVCGRLLPLLLLAASAIRAEQWTAEEDEDAVEERGTCEMAHFTGDRELVLGGAEWLTKMLYNKGVKPLGRTTLAQGGRSAAAELAARAVCLIAELLATRDEADGTDDTEQFRPRPSPSRTPPTTARPATTVAPTRKPRPSKAPKPTRKPKPTKRPRPTRRPRSAACEEKNEECEEVEDVEEEACDENIYDCGQEASDSSEVEDAGGEDTNGQGNEEEPEPVNAETRE